MSTVPKNLQELKTQTSGGLLQAAKSMLALICVGLFVLTFTIQPFRIPSASMEPTLLIGDFLLVDKSLGDPTVPLLPPEGLHRRDIIVFHDPVNSSRYLIKRIVALPGDRLHLRAGHLFLNGQLVQEPYAFHGNAPTDSFGDDFPNTTAHDPDVLVPWRTSLRHFVDHGDLLVPRDDFFVMGDNRNNSLDSRYWGFVPRSVIVGRPLCIYLSLPLDDGDAGPSQRRAELSRRFPRWNRTLTLVR